MIEYIVNNYIILILILSFICVVAITLAISKSKEKNKIHNYFIFFNITLMIHTVALIFQCLFKDSQIPLIYFDYITYLGGAFSPIFLLFVALAYDKKNDVINKIKKYIFFVPIIFLIFLWTNDFHNLFYKKYSIYLGETEYGPILVLYALYSYGFFLTSVYILIKSSIKKSGFFSIQTLLIIIGVSVPTIGNFIGLLKIVQSTIYVMPILFIVTSLMCSIAIFKLKAFNIIPVASRTVMDTMSDGYVVISNDGTIADSNLTFRNKFKNVFEIKKDDENLFEIFDKSDLVKLEELKKHIEQSRKNACVVTEEYHFVNENFDKYFEVDIHPISAKDNKKDYIATLIVLKDITQHKMDIQEIQEKQDIIVKQQQLVSIGELAGGVAHDINTPISAIKTGIVMLNTMSGDRTDSEKEILERMDNCATKIINIVNSMRNQIRNLGGTTSVEFNVNDVLNDIKTITFHEIKKNNCEVCIDISEELIIKGDPTKLGQVLTNLIVNAAQAYDEKGGKINIIVSKVNNNFALINIIDYAGGMDESITPYIFKNILTTKGTGGTGLGLYLAYSIIKGEFNGEIDFNTKKGEGTTFSIKIPLA